MEEMLFIVEYFLNVRLCRILCHYESHIYCLVFVVQRNFLCLYSNLSSLDEKFDKFRFGLIEINDFLAI